MISKEQKIFGLGLSKTGTSSLSEALNLLGIATIHYPSDTRTLQELRGGNYNLTLMNDWQGAVDISVAPFYAQLDKAFTGSKFILTIREKDPWLRSCEQHWLLMDEWLGNFPEVQQFQEFIGAVTYGSRSFNRDRFSWVYDSHVANARRYFESRPDDFLEINICEGEGWTKLCHFLDCPIPDIPFPKANEWMHLLLQAKQTVNEIIPIGERFILIDQTGFGNSFSNEHILIPFLEKGGTYWGIPENDDVAVRELSRQIESGIKYVVVGFPCFWWFEYYPEFGKVLLQNFPCLTDTVAVKIFQVRKQINLQMTLC
jgi:Sulfotransferase domain